MTATLVIDNIDSFVYNIVQYVGMLGGNPVVAPNTASLDYVERTVAEKNITHIIISPGPKRPEDAGISNDAILEYAGTHPILGVCLGHQCIGHVYGATVRAAKTLRHGKTSDIQHYNAPLFAGLPNPFSATRYHSLVVDQDLPGTLEVLATSRDDHEIMAIKHRSHPVYGVQFHPESILTDEGIKIIENFLSLEAPP